MKRWISAFRLRTLPLSLSLIAMGSIVAYQRGIFAWDICTFALLTTLGLQILSNLCNDYGDTVNGADNEQRVGPTRSMQSGAITPKEMKTAIILWAIFSLISGITLLISAFPRLGWQGMTTLFIIGLLCIGAAITYTMGKKPYGYIGLGDISVFIFFGLVGVAGSEALYEGTLWLPALLPACSIGLLSVGVLNMNNMRDYESDKQTGKKTLVVMMGVNNARIYHTILMLVSFATLITYILIYGKYTQMISLLSIPLFIKNIMYTLHHTGRDLDKQLPLVAMGTFFTVLLFVIGTLI
ncbi:MAG: 1,4-dihydroxy-2-naphthoate octaprenyltransferase [Bacteroidia bacterium]|nr:1,4-dihydroxy-2-naphthoate octaprenyltransferase [Bacteroidia bacterium]